MARWALISGDKGHDKAALALQIAERLRARGVKVGGFVQRSWRDEAADQKRYELVRLGKPEKALLAVDGEVAKGPDREEFCSYAFRNDVFSLACQWMREDAQQAQVLVIGEVSKLEASGKGHASSMRVALEQDDSKVVLVLARASQLFYVMESFGLSDDPLAALEMPADSAAIDALADQLADATLAGAPAAS
jgi:nucleoside-triphosphatase THEP1